jgi:hypothetical protein
MEKLIGEKGLPLARSVWNVVGGKK